MNFICHIDKEIYKCITKDIITDEVIITDERVEHIKGTKFQLILRLSTTSDSKKYKNSIITFLEISEKKWDKYLRNKKILYSRKNAKV